MLRQMLQGWRQARVDDLKRQNQGLNAIDVADTTQAYTEAACY